jgi:DNA-binding response OmpR family regulator
LDLTLPKLDGYQVLKLLKADKQCRKIPVLVITARSDAQGLVSTLDCGADSYYVKPLKFDTLLTLIQTLLVSKAHHEPAA